MEENQQDVLYTGSKRTAPYSVASMVLGIASLMASGLGITLVLGIIGLIFSNKGMKAYQEHPEYYTGDGMLQAGKVTSIVGIVLGSLALVLIVLVIILGLGVIAAAATGAFDL